MNLYVRKKSGIWINFVNSIQELKMFEESYIPGRHMVIGDLALFSQPMIYRLLKFVEDNPEVDCYSSVDIKNPILLSRFISIYKEPLVLVKTFSPEEFNMSKKDYVSVETLLDSYSDDIKLRAPLVSDSMLKMMQLL